VSRNARVERAYRTRLGPWATVILGLPELVHPKGELRPYALRVGPSVWQPPTDAPPPSWLDRLGADRPALLVSVSTVGQSDTGSLRDLALAAEDVGLDVVVTLPRDDAAPQLPPSVTCTGFVGHHLLLDRVALVASDAGNGTVTRAACAGVPQLLTPVGRDQFAVARGAVHAGVAVALRAADATPDTLRASLVEMSTERRFAERARRLAAAATRFDAPAAHRGRPRRTIYRRHTTTQPQGGRGFPEGLDRAGGRPCRAFRGDEPAKHIRSPLRRTSPAPLPNAPCVPDVYPRRWRGPTRSAPQSERNLVGHVVSEVHADQTSATRPTAAGHRRPGSPGAPRRSPACCSQRAANCPAHGRRRKTATTCCYGTQCPVGDRPGGEVSALVQVASECRCGGDEPPPRVQGVQLEQVVVLALPGAVLQVDPQLGHASGQYLVSSRGESHSPALAEPFM
jgi:hypothetical protein